MLNGGVVVFEQEEDDDSRSFFSEIISSISDVRFSHDGRYIVSRDYLTVKIWDVNMERQPLKTIPIHEHLRPRLYDIYENDSIFDKFEVVFSGDGQNVMTGSYNNNFMIYPTDVEKETEIVLQADKSAFKAKKVGVPTPMNKGGGGGGKKSGGSPTSGLGGRMRMETNADQIDFNKKILHMSWHPFEDSIAIAATNNVSFLLLFAVEVSSNSNRVWGSSLSSPHSDLSTRDRGYASREHEVNNGRCVIGAGKLQCQVHDFGFSSTRCGLFLYFFLHYSLSVSDGVIDSSYTCSSMCLSFIIQSHLHIRRRCR